MKRAAKIDPRLGQIDFLSITATSDPLLTFSPHLSTCFTNRDLPSDTKGMASSIGITQLDRYSFCFKKRLAPLIVNAIPPSVRKVPINFPLILKLLIFPVFLEYSSSKSFGRIELVSLPKRKST